MQLLHKECMAFHSK